MGRVDADLSGDPIALLALSPPDVFPAARRLISAHSLFARDAIHLAVAIVDAPAYADDGDVVLVTRDRRREAAATLRRPCGLGPVIDEARSGARWNFRRGTNIIPM